ncbi:TetR/AcrR family transcriptional regulator [Hwanghaeella grinnelliae]|uniref:TetR/AcrR family transcriptional regulator n=1 Tax=Hwanghaeella grinnelliae TaxID=2500179 RepID=UPI001386FF19|nr:TetR/AcrR family transcriptional regulator [Hwanghaeella grinnelliae]
MNKKSSPNKGSRTGRAGRSQAANSETRAEALITVAFDLFAERNFASVTIKDIANAAGVNTALIYYYYDNKEGLFRATLENAIGEIFAAFETLETNVNDPPLVIDEWLRIHHAQFSTVQKFVKVCLDYKGAADSDPVIDAAIVSFYEKERRLLADAIRDGIEIGLFRKVDPVELADQISTHLDGIMVRAVIVSGYDLKAGIYGFSKIVWEILGYTPEAAFSAAE